MTVVSMLIFRLWINMESFMAGTESVNYWEWTKQLWISVMPAKKRNPKKIALYPLCKFFKSWLLKTQTFALLLNNMCAHKLKLWLLFLFNMLVYFTTADFSRTADFCSNCASWDSQLNSWLGPLAVRANGFGLVWCSVPCQAFCWSVSIDWGSLYSVMFSRAEILLVYCVLCFPTESMPELVLESPRLLMFGNFKPP